MINKILTINGYTYEVLKKFPKSGQAECYLIRKNECLKVLKIYYSDIDVEKVEIIAKIRFNTFHSNILKCYEYGFYQGRFYEINEYCTGGSLQDKPPIKSFDDLTKIIVQINNGLHFCHSNGFLFLDMKPLNFFLKSESISSLVLGDFGSSEAFNIHPDYLTTITSRKDYYGPEAHTKLENISFLSKSSDYFAFGIIITELLTGVNPIFKLSKEEKMYNKIHKALKLPDYIGTNLKILISNLTKSNPTERWQYDEVKFWVDDSSYSYSKVASVYYKPEIKEALKKAALDKLNTEIKNLSFKYQIPSDNIRQLNLIKQELESDQIKLEEKKYKLTLEEFNF